MVSIDDNAMMGDPNDFAIEVGVEPGLMPPSLVWGHSCVWCRGATLGDIDNRHCGLAGTYHGFQRLEEQLDELWDEKLVGLDDQEAFDFLDGMLYGYHGDIEIVDDRSVEQAIADSHRYGKFDFLTNWDEQFDGYKSFIMGQPGGEALRILSRSFPKRLGLGVSVSKACVLTAIRAFIEWFKEQERRLSSASHRFLPPS